MADPNDKVPGQTPGRYYVDTQCIDCDLCRETAPANFTRNTVLPFHDGAARWYRNKSTSGVVLGD